MAQQKNVLRSVTVWGIVLTVLGWLKAKYDWNVSETHCVAAGDDVCRVLGKHHRTCHRHHVR